MQTLYGAPAVGSRHALLSVGIPSDNNIVMCMGLSMTKTWKMQIDIYFN